MLFLHSCKYRTISPFQLTPEDSSMIEDFQKDESEAREIARKMNVVCTKDKDKEKEKEKEREEEEKDKDDQRNHEKFNFNQKIQLCIALLKVSDNRK